MFVVMNSQDYSLCKKHFLFGYIKHAQSSTHLHGHSSMPCDVQKIALYKVQTWKANKVSSGVSTYD